MIRRLKIGQASLGLLSMAMLLSASTPAAAQGPSTFIVPFERVGPPVFDPLTGLQTGGAFINPCTAENVDVTGSTTISIAQSLLGNGETSISVSAVTKGSGTGQQSLIGYAFSESQQFSVKAPLFAGQEFDSSFSDKFALKGAKSIDNWVIRAHFRLKIAADGTVQVSLVNLTGDLCKG